ncbi:MAG TPA: RNA polymerase sigma factor, partial [Solirubrobacter sp.]
MAAIAVPLRLQRERTLRSRATRGDSAAFTAVYERHHQALYRYCRSIVRHEEDAQDALQSTMTRAFVALQDEQRDFELRPWLFRIAHNEAITILRRRPATGELEDLAAPGSLEDRVSDREELRLLQLDLADLPERQRAALILRELNGLSHAEIGVVLEISASAVKQAIFDARSALLGFREGRATACTEIRRLLSDGDGRVLRGRGVRGHLRGCPDCRRFRTDLDQRPVALRALAPPLPAGGAAALLASLLGSGSAV